MRIRECAEAFARRNECPEQTRRPIAKPVVLARFPWSVRFRRIDAALRYALRAATFPPRCFARSKDRDAVESLPPSRRRAVFSKQTDQSGKPGAKSWHKFQAPDKTRSIPLVMRDQCSFSAASCLRPARGQFVVRALRLLSDTPHSALISPALPIDKGPDKVNLARRAKCLSTSAGSDRQSRGRAADRAGALQDQHFQRAVNEVRFLFGHNNFSNLDSLGKRSFNLSPRLSRGNLHSQQA